MNDTKSRQPGGIKGAISGAVAGWLGRPIELTDGAFWKSWFGASNFSGKSVTVNSALQLSTAWACVRLISETLSTLPMNLYRDEKDAKVVARDHQLFSLLHNQPNADMSAAVFWQAYIASMLLWGAAYVEKRVSGGVITSLEFLQPECVARRRLGNGSVEWHYSDPLSRTTRVILDSMMWFTPAFTVDGHNGLSPITMGANIFGGAMAADEASASTFTNGMKSSGLVTMDAILKPEQRADIRQHVGKVSREGGVMVLEKGSAFQQLNMTPQDAELLSTRAFNIEEICFVPGTKILTLDGFKNIESIGIGESVLTHKGRWRRVRHVMQREYSGEVVTTKAKGLNAVTSTPNHPFYAQEVKPDRSNRQCAVGEPRWVDAADLQPSARNARDRRGRGAFDALTVPKLAHDLSILRLDMAEWAPSGSPKDGDSVCYSNNHRATKVRRYVDLDAEFGWLCGLYASDGSVSDHQVIFYLGSHETMATQRLQSALRSIWGVECTTTRCGSVDRTVTSNRVLAEFFADFGRRADLKVLPNFAMVARPEFRRGIVQGLIDGDGCLYGDRAQLRTTSERLAWQLRLILWAEGLNGSMRTQPPGTWSIEGRDGQSKAIHTVEWRPKPQARGSMAQTEDIVYFGLDSATRTPYAGTVYNLEVEEDESYTTEGGCVHNCRWFRVPPFMVGHAEKSITWGTGIEQQMIGFVTFVLRPWAVRIEQSVRKSLLTPVERRSYSAEFALEGLLRGDSAARAAFYSQMTQNGVMSRDECRRLENLPTMGGNAAVLTVQSNLLPIDKLGDKPAATTTQDAMKNWLGITAKEATP